MLRPKIFYEEGAEPSGDGSNAPPATLTYKYGGEEVTVDLSNQEQVSKLLDRASKGQNMEKLAEERNKLKETNEKLQQTVDGWNERLESAKTDASEFSALVADIEDYTGRKLTRAEKTDLLETGEIDTDDPVVKELKTLKEEFSSYREQQEKKAQELQVQAEAKQLIAKLDEMEANKEQFPNFDREAVYEKARQSGTTDFEMVYYYLNRDNFKDTLRKQIEDEFKTLTDKRKAAATETDTTPASLQEQPKKFDRIEDVGKSLLEEAKSGDISFFTD